MFGLVVIAATVLLILGHPDSIVHIVVAIMLYVGFVQSEAS